MMYDLVILGCGAAGLGVLKKALEEKKSVCVVADGFGATQHMNGQLACAEARGLCEFYGVPVGVDNDTAVVESVGLVRQIGQDGAVMRTQALSLPEAGQKTKVAFVSSPALVDFPAALVEHNLKKTFPHVSKWEWSEITLNQTSPHAHLLQLFDNEGCVAAFEEFLKKNKGEAELIICPPILGIKKFVTIHKRLEKNLGVRVVEQLSTTPPVAGMRFTEIIKSYFVKNQINVVWGRCVGFDVEGDMIKSVDVDCHPGILPGQNIRDPENGSCIECGMTKKISSKQFFLATGKYLGRGLEFNNGIRESIFDLPCVSSKRPMSKNVPVTQLICKEARVDQELFRLGVEVNASCEIIDSFSKKPIYSNLKAVGAVVGDII